MARVAFIGLGKMGVGMAMRLLTAGQAGSPQVIRNTQRMVLGDRDRHVVFPPILRLKDIRYGLALTRKLGIGSPFATLADRVFRQLVDLGYAHTDESKIIEASRVQPVAGH